MLYHYNDNVLLLKMFQMLGKYNINLNKRPLSTKEGWVLIRRRRLFEGGGGGGGAYKIFFVKRVIRRIRYRSQMRF